MAIALGYVVAWALGAAAVWLKNRGVSAADQLASSGMFAAGDFFTFIAVTGVVGLVPTAAALLQLRSVPRCWTALSWLSLHVQS